jgi:hypothetical protein
MVRSILRNESSSPRSSDDDSSSENSLLYRKELLWGDITIYEFPNILGDNPAVQNGSPLTIGWEYESKNVMDINLYEFIRQQSNPRRRKKDLVMKAGDRDSL